VACLHLNVCSTEPLSSGVGDGHAGRRAGRREAGPLAGVSLCFLDPSPDIAEEVTAGCLDGYLTALADVGTAVSSAQVEVAA